MNEREEAFEVAKLAAMVGGQMNLVDRMTTERMNTPANKINIHDFIKKVKNPNASFPVYTPTTPAGFAPPVDERMIQSMVPDVVPTYIPPSSEPEQGAIQPPLPPVNNPVPPADSVNLPHIVKPKQEESKMQFREDIKPFLTRSDVDSIRNSLKSIDKTLAGMLKFLQENSKPKANE
jgi:hypothetical protein